MTFLDVDVAKSVKPLSLRRMKREESASKRVFSTIYCHSQYNDLLFKIVFLYILFLIHNAILFINKI